MSLRRLVWGPYCRVMGHAWIFEADRYEFIPSIDVCARCSESVFLSPWGECLGGHPIREHYDPRGHLMDVVGCRTRGPS